MGRPKQLLRLGSRTLLRRTAEEAIASQAGATLVVIGADANLVRNELHGLHVTCVENQRWREGIGTSVSAGVERVARDGSPFDAAVLLTCDQPHVSAATIDRLIAEHESSAKPLVASAYAGTLGVPALFTRAYFDALLRLPGDNGAKDILLRHRDDVAVVEFAAGAVDLDTPADYDRFARGGESTS